MRDFACPKCSQRLAFENSVCLGGDSAVGFDARGRMQIGPQRVVPLSLLATMSPEILGPLARHAGMERLPLHPGRFAARQTLGPDAPVLSAWLKHVRLCDPLIKTRTLAFRLPNTPTHAPAARPERAAGRGQAPGGERLERPLEPLGLSDGGPQRGRLRVDGSVQDQRPHAVREQPRVPRTQIRSV